MTHEEALIDLQSIYKGHGGLYTDDSPAWELAFDALEKQIRIEHHHSIVTVCSCVRQSVCPKCLHITITNPHEYPEYCTWCGQKIDWSGL